MNSSARRYGYSASVKRWICSRLMRELLWKKLHHVVAVVGHQDGVLLVQIEDVAQRVLLFGEQVEALHVRDQRVAVAFRQRGVRRVGHRTQQRLIEIENPRQGLLVQGLAAGGEHRQRHQVDRVDRRRLVQALGDALG